MKDLIAQVNIGQDWWLKPNTPIGGASQYSSPGALISIILKNVYIAAGLVFFVLLLFGGFSIILGAGEGDPKKSAQGIKAATAAGIGFLVIFASYWIVQIIQIVTGVNILNPVI
jgi:hypothetical protein